METQSTNPVKIKKEFETIESVLGAESEKKTQHIEELEEKKKAQEELVNEKSDREEAGYNATLIREAEDVTSGIAAESHQAVQEETAKLDGIKQEEAVAVEERQKLDTERLILRDVGDMVAEQEVKEPEPVPQLESELVVTKPEFTESQRAYILDKLSGENFAGLRLSDKESTIAAVISHLCDEKVDPEILKSDLVLHEQIHPNVYNILVNGVHQCAHHDEL